MKKSHVFTILSLSILCLCSACFNNRDIQKHIIEMNNQFVTMKLDSMIKIEHSTNSITNSITAEYSFIVFTDSNQCSDCTLAKMRGWNTLLDLETLSKRKVQFIFIIEPRRGEEQSVIQSAKRIDLNHSLYIDINHCFKQANRFIPNEAMYHTFLLDENNRIILVGNPLQNKKIGEIALHIIEERIGKMDFQIKSTM